MKSYLTFCFLVISLTLSQAENGPNVDFVKDCKLSSKIPDGATSIPDDKKCFYQCILQKYGAVDDKGNLKPEKVDKKLLANFEKCNQGQKLPDQCDAGREMVQCLFPSYNFAKA